MSTNIVDLLIGKLSDRLPNHFKLVWKGSKIPRGASVNGISISWMQHGIVSGSNGQKLGYYRRTVEWGGQDKDQHEAIISTDGIVYGTDGSECPREQMDKELP